MAGETFNDLPDFEQDSPGVPVDKIDSLLDWVYEGAEDIADTPSMREYKKLKRIMRVMVNFYNKGAKDKLKQYEEANESVERLKGDIKMARVQLKSLDPFPDTHPRKKTYVKNLTNECERLESLYEPLQKKVEQYKELHHWGLKVAEGIQWLSDTFDDFVNNNLELGKKLEVKKYTLTKEQMETHLKYLNEVTYNLQESVDFFEASTDGRLHKFYILEKCMVEAQLKALAAFPEDSPRRMAEESDLEADKEFIEQNIKEGETSKKEWRRRMTELHKDFFVVLRWNRKKLKRMLGLDETLEEEKEKPKEKLSDTIFGKEGESDTEEKKETDKDSALFRMPTCPFGDP